MKLYVKASKYNYDDMLEVAKYLQSKIRSYKSEWGHAIYSRIEKSWGEVCVTVNPSVGQHTTYAEVKEIISKIISECISDAESKYPEFTFERGASGTGGYRSPTFPCIYISNPKKQ